MKQNKKRQPISINSIQSYTNDEKLLSIIFRPSIHVLMGLL